MSHTIRLSHVFLFIYFWRGGVGGWGDLTQKSCFFHRQRVEETSIKMPQGSGSTAPRVCDSEPAPTNPLWPPRCGHDICHQMCFLCRQAWRACGSRALRSDSADGVAQSCAVWVNGGVGHTHSTSVYLKCICVHYDCCLCNDETLSVWEREQQQKQT